MTTQHGSFLATRRGRLTLLLLCAVQFLDVADSSIMNAALPSIRRDLGFSAQNLQWVLSGYLPVTAGIAVAAGISSRLFARTGTRPVIDAGSLIAAAGIWYLSRIPVHGTYPASLLPGLVIMAVGLGAVLVAVTTAANAGVPTGQAGLAAGLLSTSQQLGTALGLAIFSAIATARTSTLLAAGVPGAAALTGGFQHALLACAFFLLAAAVIGLRATNTRGEPTVHPDHLPASHDRIPAPELTD